LAETTNIKK